MTQVTARRRYGAPFSLLTAADRAALPADAVDAYPLSALQSGVVFEAVSAGQPGLYHDVLTYRLPGPLDVPAFTRAVEELTRRHPIFRTSFHLTGFSEPVQVVHATVPAPLRVTDLRGLSADEVSGRLEADAGDERAAGFHYGTPDLVRIRVHLLDNDEYQYTLSYHDAAIDSTSVRIIHHDLFDEYLRLTVGDRAGRASLPDPHPVGYQDFVATERAAVGSAAQAAFWTTTLEGAEGTRIPRYGDVSADPADPADPTRTAGEPAVYHIDLPARLSDAVQAAAVELSVPLATVLATVHVRVVGFLAGRTDVLTGYEQGARPEGPGADRLAGLFLNTLPLRVDCQPGTWRELVATVRAAELAWQPHRHFPMPETKRLLGVRGPLVETVFNLTSAHGLGDLANRYGFVLPPADLNARTEFPFRAEFGHDESAGTLRFAIHHDPGQFSRLQIGRIAGYYLAALGHLCADPDGRHDQANLMEPEETRLVTRSLSGPDRPLPAGTFVDLFSQAATTWPERTALRHGEHRLDYADLRTTAEELAEGLRRHGLRPGDRCVVALPRGVPWAVTVLAVLWCGGVYVPLDPSHPSARLAAAAVRADATLVVAETDHVPAIRAGLAGRPGGDRCRVVGHDTVAPGARTGPPPGGGRDTAGPGFTVRPDDDAYILFTSGSTGEPKGARITHAGMLNHLLAKVDELGLGPDDRIAQTASQSFDISVWQLLAAWTVGAQTVLYDTDRVTDAPSFLDDLAADRISVLELVPSYLDALLTENARRPRALPALRTGMVTGEPVPVPLVRRWFEQIGVPLVNAYGPTEAADDVTHLVMHGPVLGSRVPVGRPLPNTGIHVVGTDGRHRPVGCYGEIVVTGVGVGRGYVNDPERTAEAFQPNTLDDRSALMYRTGDVGRWLPDGTLDCAGRLDSQVKLRGFRIELSEVEGAFTALSGVDGAVAVVTPAGRLAVGYLGAATLSIAGLRRSLAQVLPDYMLPDSVTALETLPLGANGKVDRRTLADRLGSDRSEHPPSGELPSGTSELFVATLFARVLGVPAERVGRDDDFFEIGGHSLAAMKVAARSDGRLALRDIVTHPTVRTLAALLDSGQVAPRPLLIRLARGRQGGPALVCAPYAGGGAVNFLPLARQLADRAADLTVYGIEPPGRTLTDPLPSSLGLDRAMEAVADELADAGHRWIAVFGQCSGSVLAVRLARLLTERTVTVSRVFTAAKLLPSADPDHYADEEFGRFSDQQVAEWVRDRIGMRDLDELSTAEIADLAHAFRTDSVESARILSEVLTHPDRARVDCPLTQIVALDDPLTLGHAETPGHWGLLAAEVTMLTLPDGGHYFNRTRPGPLAELVVTTLPATLSGPLQSGEGAAS